MFKIGDYIVKAATGVCKIENILHLDMAGVDRNKLYYQFVPLDSGKGTIYLLTESAETKVRKVMTAKEALNLIENAASVQEYVFSNDKLREQTYKEIIKENNPEELLRIIKTIYLRQKERLRQGKKITSVDEYYFSLAEKNLFSELSLVLQKNNEEILELIIASINRNTDK